MWFYFTFVPDYSLSHNFLFYKSRYIYCTQRAMTSNTKEFKNEIDWEAKAKQNPLYAIMSDEVFVENAPDVISADDLLLFFEKGQRLWNLHLQPVYSQFAQNQQLKVLEWGCGMGRLLAQPARQGAYCVGVDISHTQLGLLKKHFQTPNNLHTALLNGKQQIDVGDQSIDFVYSFAVLQHVKNTSDFYFVLSEMTRVLKKGGTLKIQFRFPNQYGAKFKNTAHTAINFEESSLLFYWKKIFGWLYAPIVRHVKHTHWGGAGCYVPLRSVAKFLEANGLNIVSVNFETQAQQLVWITAQK